MEAVSMRFSARSLTPVLAASLLLSPSTFAFDTPLSDEAIREAYFLGQRHDESLTHFLDKYTKHLPPPKTGPHIASITLFTPFALLIQLSSLHSPGYNAQQAVLDHRGQQESVQIIVQILLTDSYPAYIPRQTGSPSGSSTGFVLRPYDFWKDFDVHVFSENKEIISFASSGDPNYICEDTGPCTITGATIQLEYLAKSFASDSATVQITPPEGDPVSVDFDLISLR
jgi:hypothetical protein